MIIRPVSCNFHQLFRNDPQGLTLQKVSFSTSHLVMTLPAPFCKQYQHASHFHQSFRNKRKTRHPKAADLHQKFRIPLFSLFGGRGYFRIEISDVSCQSEVGANGHLIPEGTRNAWLFGTNFPRSARLCQEWKSQFRKKCATAHILGVENVDMRQFFLRAQKKSSARAEFSYRISSVVLCSQHAEEQFAHAALTVPLALLRADIPEFPIHARIQWRRILVLAVRLFGVAQIDAGGNGNHDSKLRAFRRTHKSHNVFIQLSAAQIILNRFVRFHRCHDEILFAVEIQTVTRIYILLAAFYLITRKDPFFDIRGVDHARGGEFHHINSLRMCRAIIQRNFSCVVFAI